MATIGTNSPKLVVSYEKGTYHLGGQIYHEGIGALKKDLKKLADANPKVSQRQRKKNLETVVKVRNVVIKSKLK